MGGPSNRPITELENLKQQLAVIQARISELEQRPAVSNGADPLRTLIDSTFLFVAVLDPNGSILELKRAAAKTALNPKEAEGKHLAEVYFWEYSPETPRAVRDAVEAAAQGNPVRLNLKIWLRAGDYAHVAFSVLPVRDRTSRITALVASALDISEDIEAAGLNEILRQRLAESSEELNQFAYAASHDLQEPLRTIVTHAQLLTRRHKAELSQEPLTLLGEIEKAAARMRVLVMDLLSFSRVVNAPVDDSRRSDANAALQWAIMNLAEEIKATGAQITWDPLPVVQADDTQLVQLFQNLLSNSLKFRGPEAPIVHVSAEPAGEFYKFSVRDNAVGIEPQYHERVFGLFKRLHGKEFAGTGIGLAICSKIASRWGGRIWVESSGGPGSTFYFTLRSVD